MERNRYDVRGNDNRNNAVGIGQPVGHAVALASTRMARCRRDIWRDYPFTGDSIGGGPVAFDSGLFVERLVVAADHGRLGSPYQRGRRLGCGRPETITSRVRVVRTSVGSMVPVARHREHD